MAKEPGGAPPGMYAEMPGGKGKAQGWAQPLVTGQEEMGAVGLPTSPDSPPLPGCSSAWGFPDWWLEAESHP